ncbi:MAG TPA: hypothetical protein VNR18_11355 [Hyphomicrobiales bacterium]|nr:hypothetical protein [Hyphomicrobiales bacterium]
MTPNKSLLTNAVAATLCAAGLALPGTVGAVVLNTGLYALCNAATNWLALYMLFEKVPYFYGSGVIPSRFEEFRAGIRQLVMEQFFNEDNLRRFLGEQNSEARIEAVVDTLLEQVDFDRAFEGLVEVIRQSSFGGMLALVGGERALQPLRAPFIARMQAFLRQTAEGPELRALFGPDQAAAILERVEHIVDSRLRELTPELVKDIVQKMIRKHLGWLVVWGGVIGGLIGLVVALLQL